MSEQEFMSEEKSSPEHQVEMLLVRMILNQAIIPPPPTDPTP